MSQGANIKMLAGLHSFLEALEENPFPASLAPGPPSACSKPAVLQPSDHSLILSPTDSKLNMGKSSNFKPMYLDGRTQKIQDHLKPLI